MARHGFISPEEAQTTLQAPLALKEGRAPGETPGGGSDGLHFAMYVRDLLPTLLGGGRVEGGLKVTTTLDLGLQAQAESTLRGQLDRLEPQVGASNGALVSLDPKTGEILAMVGSHDFFRSDISGQVNNALSLNQPGSTMKPITYLAAFMKGWSPATIVRDEPINVADGESSYVLRNADGWYRGDLSVRNALGSSLNVPAVKALEYAGLQQVYDLARRLGLSTLSDISAYGPAFTLGGVDVSLLDMTYAFSVFANQGEQAGMPTVLEQPKGARSLDPVAVLRIETTDGRVLWEHKARKERIVPANAAYLISHVLSDDSARVSMFGPNSPLNLGGGRPAAVKSGLSDNARDAWAIGYTPQLVTGVWVGNANNEPMRGATSTYTAAPIWRAFMLSALQNQPILQFMVPEGIQTARICATTGLLAGSSCRNAINEVFLAGRAPTTTGEPPRATPAPTRTPARRPQATPTPREQDEERQQDREDRGRGRRDSDNEDDDD
jgi:membrane peptidoglycan carboxypeptidase